MGTKSEQRRPGRAVVAGWAEGEELPEGLGGVDPDYDRADDAVPQVLRGQWRVVRFEGE